jgi:predicted flap endonuclease-1-like 5' DNA nuclease
VAAGAATAAAVSRAAGDAGEALEDMAEAGARMVGIDLDFDPEEAEKLRQAGIERAGTLLERGAARQGRVELAKELGVEESTVLKWVNRLDLARVKGIGIKYANLLEEAGVDTVVELAQRNPQNLFKKLVEVNEELGLVEALPSEEEVAEWVAQAKELPRVISY